MAGRVAAPTIAICGSLCPASSTWKILLFRKARGLASSERTPAAFGQDGRMRMAFAQRCLDGGVPQVAACGLPGGLRCPLDDVPGGLIEAYRNDLGLEHVHRIANVYGQRNDWPIFSGLSVVLHVEHWSLRRAGHGRALRAVASARIERIRAGVGCSPRRRREVPRCTVRGLRSDRPGTPGPR